MLLATIVAIPDGFLSGTFFVLLSQCILFYAKLSMGPDRKIPSRRGLAKVLPFFLAFHSLRISLNSVNRLVNVQSAYAKRMAQRNGSFKSTLIAEAQSLAPAREQNRREHQNVVQHQRLFSLK